MISISHWGFILVEDCEGYEWWRASTVWDISPGEFGL